MAHNVKCVYCKEVFDRDKEPYVEVSQRRYAHKVCAEAAAAQLTPAEKARQEEEQDLKKLEHYIMHLFNETFVNVKIRKQIMDYRKNYGYTYSGILKSLQWWFEIKKNSLESANDGIGIVPYIYKQASDYYYSLFIANRANEDLGNYQQQTVSITISSPRAVLKQKRKFKLTEADDE